MKKVIVFVALFLFVTAQNVFAQTPISLSITPTPAPTTTQYQLAYPGILPDSPLYPLKAIRDRIVLFFINDPAEKAKFELLVADKHLSAAISLLAERPPKPALAQSSVAKGENYFEDAISSAKLAKSNGQNIGTLVDILSSSLDKHTQVLTGMEETIAPPYKDSIVKSLSRVMQFREILMTLRTK
ncbi:MAG TPA: DUF5667 domain-containing protein [Candidatus Saccharimonadales bacterium]|nr:DUF5667 domain-containing protein [Candidatus Saccharimonadales bacterium]